MTRPAPPESAFFWNTGKPSVFLLDRMTIGERIAASQADAQTCITGDYLHTRESVMASTAKRRTGKRVNVDIDAVLEYARQGHTQDQCAARFGIGRSTVGAWLNGKRRTK